METYHHKTYARVHPAGTPKGDYQWRLDALSRAFEVGQDDLGIGALFGLSDWRFDVLGSSATRSSSKTATVVVRTPSVSRACARPRAWISRRQSGQR